MRASVVALVFALGTAMLPDAAAAHLRLVRSTPAQGERLLMVPHEIRLTFSESIQPAFTRIELIGPDGVEVRLSAPAVSGTDVGVPVAGALVAGRYVVAWRTAGADGHPVSGRIEFTIDEQAEGLATTEPHDTTAAPPLHHDPVTFPGGDGFTAQSAGYVLVRWFTFIGLLGVIGIVAFRLFVLGFVQRAATPAGLALLPQASALAATVALGFSMLLLLVLPARLYVQSLAMFGTGGTLDLSSVSTILLQTTWGRGWILQAAGTVVAFVGFWMARSGVRSTAVVSGSDPNGLQRGGLRRLERVEAAVEVPNHSGAAATAVAEEQDAEQDGTDRRTTGPARMGGWWVAAAGVLMLAFTPALSGHAAAVPDRTLMAVFADGLHVLGAGGWLGSLLAVMTIGVPAAIRLGAVGRQRAVAALVNAFSPTALFFAGLVTVTGVFAASLHLGSVAELWQSTYGRTLALKLIILSVVLGTGAYNWLRVRPALEHEDGTRRLRQSAGIELAAATAVLLVTAVLVATPPPMDVAQSADPPATGALP